MNKSYNYKDILHQYIKYDQDNKDHALFQLAQMYFYGNKHPKDQNKAIEIINDIGNNLPSAYTFLGLAYLYGEDIKKDIEKGIYYLDIAANKNDSDAILALSSIYLIDTYVPQDINKALSLLEQGSQLGFDNSMVQLGLIYINSPYVEPNQKKAYELFVKADAIGNPNASSFLGIMYENGDYVEKDLKKAFQCYLKGSSGNSEVGHFFLGKMYYEGIIVKANTKEAVNHFMIAASYGYAQALYRLIEIYFDDSQIANIPKAKSLLESLLKTEDPFALYMLGKLQIEGLHYPLNITEGISNLEKANTSEANLLLGNIYNQGDIIDKDPSVALNYYFQSIELGNEDAIVEAAEIIIDNAFSNDFLYLLKAAKKLGNSKGIALLGICYLKGLSVKRNIAKALTFFKSAAKKDNAIALRYLGFLYQYGIGVERNEKKAFTYYSRAIVLNDNDSEMLIEGLKKEYNPNNHDNKIYFEYFNLAINLTEEISK